MSLLCCSYLAVICQAEASSNQTSFDYCDGMRGGCERQISGMWTNCTNPNKIEVAFSCIDCKFVFFTMLVKTW